MHVLAFDTCLDAVSVAVAAHDDGGLGARVLCDRFETGSAGAAERLMPMIGEVMSGAGVGFSDLDRIAVTVGPGSFTGVRTGIAAARGLALASGRPAVGISVLAAIAYGANRQLEGQIGGRAIAVATDARREMVYFGLFGRDGEAHHGPALQTPAGCATLVGSLPVVVVGSAAGPVSAAIMDAGGSAEVAPVDNCLASWVALMAPNCAIEGAAQPLYLRPPDVRPQHEKALPRAAS